MTDEKKAVGQTVAEEVKESKVTTGAWWKSALSLLPRKKKEAVLQPPETGNREAAVKAQTEAVNADPQPEKKPSRRGRSRRKPQAGRGRGGGQQQQKQQPQPQKQQAGPEQKGKKGPQQQAAQAKGKQQNKGTDKESSVYTKLLINAEEPEECRIALVENGRLESFHVTSVLGERAKNNIYKGKIVSIEPNLQAAFVEYGWDRNGFLPFDEIHPEYYRQDVDAQSQKLINEHQWKKLKIEKVVKKGQEVLVQVVKEALGTKGANMTTYLSIPGRNLVLMPGSDSAGISKKIVDEDRRFQLREMMNSFNIPEGIGYILRTASHDITKTALRADVRYLLRLWDEIKKRGQEMQTPALLYEDQDIIARFLRDHFDSEIREILVDSQEAHDKVQKFLDLLPTKQRKVKVKLHKGPRPIFNLHNIEDQIESIYKPQVQLPSGGSIVINPTEALVAIDVNSGRTSKDSNFEESIFLANMEAAAELARQLRLRDLGGLIVVDFIDMRSKKHIREVEKKVRQSMKRDKAKVDTSTISRFGLMQISRQKMGAPIEKGSYRICEYCQGRGTVKSVETQSLYYLRRIQTGVSRKNVSRVECHLPTDVAEYLLNKKRTELAELEERHHARIDIITEPEMKPGDNKINFLE